MSHRFITHYGQQRARLCTGQSIIDGPCHQERRMFKIADRLLFSVPREYTRRLDALFVDRLVYLQPWRKFISAAQNEWKSSIIAGLALSM